MTDFYIPQKIKQDLWYREPWMWLVVGGPVVVVIAGFITLYLAMHGADKVVAKDYYKQGININKIIEQDAQAAKYQMQGEMRIDNGSNKIILNLQGNTQYPKTVLMTATSNTGASEFEALQKITLYQVKDGLYEGPITTKSPSSSPLWHIKIEADDWRLAADWRNPLQQAIQLKPQN